MVLRCGTGRNARGNVYLLVRRHPGSGMKQSEILKSDSVEPPEGQGGNGSLGETARQIALSLRKPAMSPLPVFLFAGALDVVSVALALWFAGYIAAGSGYAALASAATGVLVGLLAVVVLRLVGRYQLQAFREVLQNSGWIMLASVTGLVLLSAFGLRDGPFFAEVLAALICLPLVVVPARTCLSWLANGILDYGLTERRGVLVGGGSGAAELIRTLNGNEENDIQIRAIFDDRSDARSPNVVMGIPKIGNVDDLVAFSRLAEIDVLIIALPLEAERRIREILEKVRVLPLDVRLAAYNADQEFRRRFTRVRSTNGMIRLLSRPLSGWSGLVKRVMDVVVALFAIVALSPILLITAVLIRQEDPGPVIFKQIRHGYNHKPVEIWKFRSMYLNQMDATARNVVTRGDPRVTRVGRFIRKWSIDELPQLFNVLRGELSLVGPRPHVVDAVSSQQQAFEEIVSGYAARHKVKPGVTGWAQIHGLRGEIDAPESLRQRVEHDLYYIENHTIWMDLYVLLMTPLCLLNTKNAY